jgi:hypothetical protein
VLRCNSWTDRSSLTAQCLRTQRATVDGYFLICGASGNYPSRMPTAAMSNRSDSIHAVVPRSTPVLTW